MPDDEFARQVDVLGNAVEISVDGPGSDGSGLRMFAPHFLLRGLNRGVFFFGAKFFCAEFFGTDFFGTTRRNWFHRIS
jgi:hypothetical protein